MHQLCDRLKTTAQGLGLLRLQLDAGMLEEVRTSLVQFRDEFQLLRYGVEGEMEAAAAKPRPKVRKARRALLVEDDRNQRELLAGFLRQSGLTVDVAGDGADALDYLGTHARPDVVLLDMGLPRVDGPTMVRQIRNNPDFGGLKIFGVTGRLPEEFDLERGRAAWTAGFRSRSTPRRSSTTWPKNWTAPHAAPKGLLIGLIGLIRPIRPIEYRYLRECRDR